MLYNPTHTIVSVEVPKERQIKDIGARPHNLPGSRLAEKMQAKERAEQLGVLMLKPGCFSTNTESNPVQEQTEKLLSSHNLDVLATSCVALTRDQIHQLYPNIFGQNIKPKTFRLSELRLLLEEYLSDCVFAYLVHGNNVQQRLELIKETLRQDVEKVGNWDVENRVHVPEEENLDQVISLLFYHESCSVCIKNE